MSDPILPDRVPPFADLKLHLQSTDYGNFLASVPSPLQVSVIDDNLREKLVTEFQHMRNHATGELATFLDFITYSYMIDNIILLITGTLHQRPISELVTKCHPLGSFEQVRRCRKIIICAIRFPPLFYPHKKIKIAWSKFKCS